MQRQLYSGSSEKTRLMQERQLQGILRGREWKSVERLAIEYFLCGRHMIIWKILRGRESSMDRGSTGDTGGGKRLIRRDVLKGGIAVVLAVCLLPGCAVRTQKTEKANDLKFVVLDKENVPQEFKSLIEEKKDTPFKMTYADQGKLYIAEGYGSQPTSGYSVEVEEVYETQDTVYIRINLLGPEKGEEIKEKTTFPYVVIQMEYIEKDVRFD